MITLVLYDNTSMYGTTALHFLYLSGSKSPQSVLAAWDALHAGFGAAVGCMTPLLQPGGAAGAACIGCMDCIG